MNKTIEVPFDIENVEVFNTEINEAGQLIITVRNTDESVCCHGCGKIATELYGHADVRQVRHTSGFGMETYIRFYPKTYGSVIPTLEFENEKNYSTSCV